MEKAYKFRIYPNTEQQILIQKTFGCVRYVYNHYLAQRQDAYHETGKSPTRFQQDRDLTVLKQNNEWLREPDKCALQNALIALDISYQNFFRGVKTGKSVGYPKFKRKHDNRRSYKTSSGIHLLDKAVKLPKLGLVDCRVSKQIEGRIISATISQSPSGKYFVSLCCTDVELEQPQKTGEMVGVDLGIKDFAITSNGEKFENHKYLRKGEKKLVRLQRELSRKTKGSKNREKARIKVARQHERIANQRTDTLHKLSTQLIKDYDVIALETLAVKNMVKNHKRAKSISDAAWGEFVRQVQYKAEWYGKEVVRIDRFFPSSQLCSTCGAQWSGTKDCSVREWTCPVCGETHDRDINAAINILNEGLRIAAA